MTKKTPRTRKALDPKDLLTAYRILCEAPNYDGKRQLLDWIEGSLKVAGYVLVNRAFYRQSEIHRLSPLSDHE